MNAEYTDYLILGAGCAGVTAAEEIRKNDRNGSVIMLSNVDFAFKRPLLSKTPMQRIRGSNYLMHTEEWLHEEGIRFIKDCNVLSLNTEKRTASTDRGDFSYGECIYALGGYNFIPPIKGADKQGVMTVRGLEDLRDLKRGVLTDRKAVVIGGGVIGIEIACELGKYGIDVTILEAMPRLMPRQLDENTSALLLNEMKDFHIYTGITVHEICGDERAAGIMLEDGRYFPCSMVFVSCGQKANINVARAAGIKCGKAVIVDRKMKTSAPHVYACGDCAEVDGMNYALWTQAIEEGRIAGSNASGESCELEDYDRSLLMSLGNVNVFACGDPGLDPEKKYECITEEKQYGGFNINDRRQSAVEKRFYRGKMVGGTIIGSLRGMQAMKNELEGKIC